MRTHAKLHHKITSLFVFGVLSASIFHFTAGNAEASSPPTVARADHGSVYGPGCPGSFTVHVDAGGGVLVFNMASGLGNGLINLDGTSNITGTTNLGFNGLVSPYSGEIFSWRSVGMGNSYTYGVIKLSEGDHTISSQGSGGCWNWAPFDWDYVLYENVSGLEAVGAVDGSDIYDASGSFDAVSVPVVVSAGWLSSNDAGAQQVASSLGNIWQGAAGASTLTFGSSFSGIGMILRGNDLAVSSLVQRDGPNSRAEGGVFTQDSATLKAMVSSITGGQGRLQVEIKPFGTAFDGGGLLMSEVVSSSSTASVNSGQLPVGQYHWRARATDDQVNVFTDWQEFGQTGNTDFIIASPFSGLSQSNSAPIVARTGYDDTTNNSMQKSFSVHVDSGGGMLVFKSSIGASPYGSYLVSIDGINTGAGSYTGYHSVSGGAIYTALSGTGPTFSMGEIWLTQGDHTLTFGGSGGLPGSGPWEYKYEYVLYENVASYEGLGLVDATTDYDSGVARDQNALTVVASGGGISPFWSWAGYQRSASFIGDIWEASPGFTDAKFSPAFTGLGVVLQGSNDLLSGLEQLDETTLLTETGISKHETVTFKGTVHNPTGGQTQLQVEVKPINQAFDGNGFVASGSVSSDEEAEVNSNYLVNGRYHWRARAAYDNGITTRWQEFGAVGNTDFFVAKTVRVAVVMMDLQDPTKHVSEGTGIKQPCTLKPHDTEYPDGHTTAYYRDLTDCVKSFHHENSYVAITPEFVFIENTQPGTNGWLLANGDTAAYVSSTGTETDANLAIEAATEAVVEDDPAYDAVIVVHSGIAHQDSGITNFGDRRNIVNGSFYYHNKGYVIVSEFSSVGTWAHELGHVLGSLSSVTHHTTVPDLYLDTMFPGRTDTDLGKWELMATGERNGGQTLEASLDPQRLGDGTSPPNMSSYTKAYLGLLNLDDGNQNIHSATETGSFLIDFLETNKIGDGVFRYNLADNAATSTARYLILEGRRKDFGYWDSSLPSKAQSNLVIYSVDTKGAPKYGLNSDGRRNDLPRRIVVADALDPEGAHYVYDDMKDNLRISALGITTSSGRYKIHASIEPIDSVLFSRQYSGEILTGYDQLDLLPAASSMVYSPFYDGTKPGLDLHAVCPGGRHVGMNYQAGVYENQVAESIVSSNSQATSQWIFLPTSETGCHYYVSSYRNQKFLQEHPDIASGLNDTSDAYDVFARHIDPNSGIFTSSTLTNQNIQSGQNIEHGVAGTTDVSVASGIPDSVAPVTTEDPGATPGYDGWYTSPIDITLSASDTISGVLETRYSVDAGATYQTYAGPVYLSQDGVTHFAWYSIDNAGNVEGEHKQNFLINTSGFVVAITNPINNATSTQETADVYGAYSDLTESGSSTAEVTSVNVNNTTCDISDGSFTCSAVPLVEGTNNLIAIATDSLTNSATTSISILRDTTPPETSITEGPTGSTTSTSATLAFTSSESNSTFLCALDGATGTPCTSPVSLSDLSPGSLTFSVLATDSMGNVDVSPATQSWTVALPAPDTTMLSTPASSSDSTNAEFTFSSSAPSLFECQIDGSNWASCYSPMGYSGLTVDDHLFAVRSSNAAGADVTPASYSWIVTLPPPPDTSIVASPDDSTTSTEATFAFISDEDGSTFTCSLDAASGTTCSSPMTYTGLSVANHAFSVYATNSASETDATPATFSWTVDALPIPDTTITSGPTGSTTSTSATFAFSADVAGATFECQLDGGDWSSCASSKTYDSLGDGTSTFVVRASTNGGTDATPASATWTVDATAPTLSISSPADNSLTSATSTTIVGTASDGGIGLASVTTSSVNCSVSSGTFTCLVVGLSEGTNVLTVTATDIAGNSSVATVHVTSDNTSPDTSITGGPTGSTTSTQATFTFSSSESGSNLACSLDSATATPCTSPTTYTNLSVAGHDFSVDATDAAGNVDLTPATRSWTVIAPPNTSIGSGPNSTTSLTSATLTFSSTTTGATFQCQIDGSSWSTCTSPKSYSSLTLNSHSFGVRSVDTYGTTDPTPATRNWTVIPPPDTAINSGSANPTPLTSATFTFSSTTTAATFECKLDSGAYSTCTSPKTYSGLSLATHTFNVRAKDTDGTVDTTPATMTWSITSDPDTAITSGPAAMTSSHSATFTFVSIPTGANFQCHLDGAAWGNCSSPKTYSGLATGNHMFYVRAKSGNNVDQFPATWAWTIQ